MGTLSYGFGFTACHAVNEWVGGQCFARVKAPQRDRFVPMLLVEAISHPVLFFGCPELVRFVCEPETVLCHNMTRLYLIRLTNCVRACILSGLGGESRPPRRRRRPGVPTVTAGTCHRPLEAVPHRPPPPSW